ncbi:MAG TPA: hypothetical protein VHG91_16950 [Longimicrobium sp.]|nr:hypothetical protein [Longimicrobium sp.]
MLKLKLETLAVSSFDTGTTSADTDRYTSCVPECNNPITTLPQQDTILM